MLKATHLAGFNSRPTRTIVTSDLQLFLDAGNNNSYSGTGTTWTDISGNGRNLTLTNSPTFTSTGGGYFTFDGSTQYASGTDHGLGTGNVSHTLEMWVYFNTITGTRWWLCLLGQADTGALHWIGTSATATQFGIWNSTGQTAPNLLGTGQWLHVVTTYNASSIITYVNTVATSPVTATDLNFTSTSINIGQTPLGEAYFAGRVSKVRIYNRALSEVEIGYNFEAERYNFPI